MRKHFMFFLCLCLIGLLWGCGKSVPHETKVGSCLSGPALPIHTAAIDALSEKIVPVDQFQAEGDPDLQLQQAESYLQQGCSLLLAEPVDTQTANALAELSLQHQIPMIFTDFSADHSIADRAFNSRHIGHDPAQAGTLLAGLLEQIPGDADTNEDGILTYLLVTGPEADPLSTALAKGCEDAMTNAILAERISCDGSSESARSVCEQALAAYGRDVEVILTTDDAIGVGALDAIRDRGWVAGTDGYVLSISLQESARSLLKVGKLSGLVIPDTAAYSSLVTELAQQLLDSTSDPKNALAPWIALSTWNP